jgi:hypothetical protein
MDYSPRQNHQRIAWKRKVTLLILLFILSSLLLTGASIYKSGFVPAQQLKGNTQEASLVGLADTTDNIHLDLLISAEGSKE